MVTRFGEIVCALAPVPVRTRSAIARWILMAEHATRDTRSQCKPTASSLLLVGLSACRQAVKPSSRQAAQHTPRRQWQFQDFNPKGICDRIGNRGRDADDRRFG